MVDTTNSGVSTQQVPMIKVGEMDTNKALATV